MVDCVRFFLAVVFAGGWFAKNFTYFVRFVAFQEANEKVAKLETKVSSLKDKLKEQQQLQLTAVKANPNVDNITNNNTQANNNNSNNTRIETLQQALQASQMSVGKLHERIRELENELLSFNLKKEVNLQLQQVSEHNELMSLHS